ncbi:acetylornithine deacetylase [Roseibium salinum]|uniref:Acetylornithine deacetylase n=1 Tax=Roseibium salinum TaxID=1604349 RepID=A0ABT3R6D9_9HYPH|nr:acetylornithine deacetylase [Roseibium sp. DSM 29163]MCX2724696.1 acetylornithine deacetylase [Roseibium sp. DSM 29163]
MSRSYSPREMLETLISFNTVSDRSNLGLIAFVEDYLAGLGVTSVRVPDATGEKAGLHALVGPAVDGGVVLSAHTDVVPVDGQAWTQDPFNAWEEGGRLYGRGAADMKGFAATVLAKVPDFLAADLKRPVHIALSYDEETGCHGASPLIRDLLDTGPRPDFVIVGEPTRMKVVTGHKGIALLKTRIHGHPVHSSQLHRGVSAISAAARLITWLDGKTAENRAKADPDCPFEPPYTTLHCGTISGGQAHNITAQHCEFMTDIRLLPGESAEDWIAAYKSFIEQDVVPGMRAVSADCRIDVEEIANVPGLRQEDDGRAEAVVRRLTGDNARSVVVYATEGGIFQNHGLSTVVCGPGSIDQAHQPDEYIELAELDRCAAFLDRLLDGLASVDN